MSQQQSGSSQSSLRPTHVVTCFLLRFDGSEPRLLIVRRSQHVGSYHGRWAGVSGFIEKDTTPEQQASTEIREETGLLGEQIRMLRRGTVVEYEDTEIGRHWYIHPFLFEVIAPDAIRLDWEATEMRWIRPSELKSYETVPRLVEAHTSAANGEQVA